MTNISKCLKGCDKREQCYRWTSAQGYRQAYSDFAPDENGDCEYFWDNKGE